MTDIDEYDWIQVMIKSLWDQRQGGSNRLVTESTNLGFWTTRKALIGQKVVWPAIDGTAGIKVISGQNRSGLNHVTTGSRVILH